MTPRTCNGIPVIPTSLKVAFLTRYKRLCFLTKSSLTRFIEAPVSRRKVVRMSNMEASR